jgi:hypothetical protein
MIIANLENIKKWIIDFIVTISKSGRHHKSILILIKTIKTIPFKKMYQIIKLEET